MKKSSGHSPLVLECKWKLMTHGWISTSLFVLCWLFLGFLLVDAINTCDGCIRILILPRQQLVIRIRASISIARCLASKMQYCSSRIRHILPLLTLVWHLTLGNLSTVNGVNTVRIRNTNIRRLCSWQEIIFDISTLGSPMHRRMSSSKQAHIHGWNKKKTDEEQSNLINLDSTDNESPIHIANHLQPRSKVVNIGSLWQSEQTKQHSAVEHKRSANKEQTHSLWGKQTERFWANYSHFPLTHLPSFICHYHKLWQRNFVQSKHKNIWLRI